MSTWPPKTNYAAGDILTAAQMTDIGNQMTPLGYTAGKNKIINGGFDIWQRGTSYNLTTTPSYGCADRFGFAQATTAAATASQVTSGLPNSFRYGLKLQRNSSATSTGIIRMDYVMETADSIPLAGDFVTISFWARAGANFSAASSLLNVGLTSGTGTDQSLALLTTGGWTGVAGVTLSAPTVALTTSYQRFTLVSSAALASTITQLGLTFYYTPVGTAGADDSFSITGIQIERGSSATPFSRNNSSIQGELAACQRYYQRYSQTALTAQLVPNAGAVNTTVVDFGFPTQVTFRVKPGSLETVNVGVYQFSNGTTYSGGTWSIPNDYGNPNIPLLRYTHGSAVFTANNICGLVTTSSSNAGYIGLSAEL